MSIKTPLNIDYQIQALDSLRKGIVDYDRRRGWRGPITNIKKNKNWEKKVAQFSLDPTLNWNLVEIISVNNSQIKFKKINNGEENFEGKIFYDDIKWTLNQNKSVKDIHEIGDILFVKKENNFWKIMQYPRVNGGIVVLNPITGMF